jgi:hypothetical protein
MRTVDNKFIYGEPVVLEQVDPGRSRFSFGSVSLVIAQLLVVAFLLKMVFPPLRDGATAALARLQVSLATRDVEAGHAQRAADRLRGAMELRSDRLSVSRGIMEVARHCDRDVWEKASAIVFFHQNSSDADRSEILMWSLLRGEHSYFDKLIASLPQGFVDRDPELMRLAEWRAMAAVDGSQIGRNPERGSNQ